VLVGEDLEFARSLVWRSRSPAPDGGDGRVASVFSGALGRGVVGFFFFFFSWLTGGRLVCRGESFGEVSSGVTMRRMRVCFFFFSGFFLFVVSSTRQV